MDAIAAVETALFTAFRFVSNGQGHASRHWLLPALECGWHVVTLTALLGSPGADPWDRARTRGTDAA